MREFSEKFKQGEIDYLKGVEISSKKSYHPEYINGFHAMQKGTRCGKWLESIYQQSSYKKL